MAVIAAASEQGRAAKVSLPTPVIVAGLALAAAVLHLVTPFNHDEAYFLEAAGRLLDGGGYGKDILDMNPPHVYWISAIPVWLARQIGARTDEVASFFTVAMAAVSLIASGRLIARGAATAPPWFLAVAAIVVLFVPGYDFGQREHWMVLLTLPYIVLRCRRADGDAIPVAAAAAIGAVACLGFCIKPYYLLVPVAIEGWLLVRTRRPLLWLAPETVAMAVTGLAYLAAVVVYVPTYFNVQLPQVLLGYWAYRSPAPEVLAAVILSVMPAALFGMVASLTRAGDEPSPALAQVFAAAGVAFLVAAVAQMKSWSYHFLPAAIFLDLAVAVALVGGMRRPGMTGAIRAAALFGLIGVCGMPAVIAAVRHADNATAARVSRLAAVFRAHPGPNRTVAAFITSPRDVYPAIVAARLKSAVPFCCEYLIAAAVRANEAAPARRAAIRQAGRAQAERAVAAIRASEPGVIVFATGDEMLGFGGRRFDYLPWLAERTAIAAVLKHYREIAPVGRFRLFVRN